MYDPTAAVSRREDRNMDVSDITGNKASKRPPRHNLPPTAPVPQRTHAIRPRPSDYDILNPSGHDALR